jgi:hypothetical protein
MAQHSGLVEPQSHKFGRNSEGISKGVQNLLIPYPFCLQTVRNS